MEDISLQVNIQLEEDEFFEEKPVNKIVVDTREKSSDLGEEGMYFNGHLAWTENQNNTFLC